MGEGFIEYITKDGDRWDLIAYAHYGVAEDFERIIRANPHIPVTSSLTGGLRLLIPVVEAAEIIADDDLPPWKRGG